MAIKFKEINDRLELSPLSDKELAAIDKLEEFIDAQILERYKGHELRFSLYQVQFKRTTNDQGTDWPDARRKLMYQEIQDRYKRAGWVCEEEIADVHERYGQDYWVLKGKR
jgi:aspartyl-tRNA synthetase